VWVVKLENEGYASTFGNPSADPYLARTLPAAGALLTQYYATGHVSNDNYVSFVSGQAPNPDNQSDCQYFTDNIGTQTPDGQQAGVGCVYPAGVKTVADQLAARRLSWKGYMEDMGNVSSRESVTCAHPALNSQDNTQSAVAGDGYVTRHDPFVYFHSIIDDQASCGRHVVPLGSPAGAMPAGTPPGVTGLAHDLATGQIPNYSFITPDVCDDGHDYPCTNEAGHGSALTDIDTFLQTWVPKITSTAAFRTGGLLEIAFDESATSDAAACCGETPGPSSPLPGITGPGGGRTGAVLLSPFIRGGTVSGTAYNHYSSLATVEDLFGLARLGEARAVTSTFGGDVFTQR
jgi:hypothetical protein